MKKIEQGDILIGSYREDVGVWDTIHHVALVEVLEVTETKVVCKDLILGKNIKLKPNIKNLFVKVPKEQEEELKTYYCSIKVRGGKEQLLLL